MPETTGCQMWGIMNNFLLHNSLTDRELDAIKRRLFGFGQIMWKHDIGISDIQGIADPVELRMMINEFTGDELAEMFY